MNDDEMLYCRIETEQHHAIVIAFDRTRDADFLRALIVSRRFSLVIEGMVPVIIATRPLDLI
jgi:hypothetical protein